MSVCDFCSQTPVRWRYPASASVIGVIGPVKILSDGDWAACDACHDLIEAGDAETLLQRSMDTFPIEGTTVIRRRAFIGPAHAGFFRARTGPAVLEP